MLQPQTKYGVETMQSIRMLVLEMHSGFNDGFIASHYKRELFIIKHLLEQIYNNAPTFSNEKEWEHEILLDKLSEK